MTARLRGLLTALAWRWSIRSGCAAAYADGFAAGFEQGRKSLEEQIPRAFAAGHAEGQQDLMRRMRPGAGRPA